MSYLVLARKYRPQNFSEIIGQEHIVTVLKNAIRSNKSWHAYIFSGTRGTGKTSTARILAKALNCQYLTSDNEPCGKCISCAEITKGSSVDVIEIDAASNRGIEEIRTLRENVKFAPVNSKYKIYIIDEAHQITEQAFNAFLKTLEEPPPYVIFILATTEFRALPLTIVSRCQVFQFRPVNTEIIFQRLKYIVSKETQNIKIDDDSLRLIAQNSGGSVRDSLSLLDQVLSFIEEGTVNSKIIKNMLGYTPQELIEQYLDRIISGEIKEVISYVDKLYELGTDFVQFSKDLIESFRGIMFALLNIDAPTSFVDTKKYVDKFSITKIVANIQLLLNLLEDIKRTEFPKIVFELYSIKLTKQYVELEQIVDIIEKISSNEKNVLSQEIISFTSSTQKINTFDKSSSDIIDWDKIVEVLRLEQPLIYSFLANAETVLEGNVIKIFLPNRFMQTTAKKYLTILEEYLKKTFNKIIKVEFTVKTQTQKIVLAEQQQEENKQELKTIPLKSKKVIDPEVEKFLKSVSGKIVEKQDQEKEITLADNNENTSFEESKS